MKVAYIDECIDDLRWLDGQRKHIFAVTALVVDEVRINATRRVFYEKLSDFIRPDGRQICLAPTLHGSDMLRDRAVDDQRRIQSFVDVVDIVLKEKLRIYRVAYWKEEAFGENMLGLCFSNLLLTMQPEFENEILLPIVELDKDSKKQNIWFAAATHSMHQYRDHIGHENIPIRNSHNICETAFFPKQYSPLGNMADVICYILMLQRRRMLNGNLSSFHESILQALPDLDPAVRYNDLIEMQMLSPAVDS